MDPAVIAAIIAGVAAVVSAVISWRKTDTLRNDIFVAAAKEVTEKRLTAYSKLWALTSVAKPSNPDIGTMEKRNHLEARLSKWYFKNGGGMLMSPGVRETFVDCKDILVDQSVDSSVVVSHLSLLRSRLKGDIRGLYDDPENYRD